LFSSLRGGIKIDHISVEKWLPVSWLMFLTCENLRKKGRKVQTNFQKWAMNHSAWWSRYSDG